MREYDHVVSRRYPSGRAERRFESESLENHSFPWWDEASLEDPQHHDGWSAIRLRPGVTPGWIAAPAG
ncbi:MAG: hypothetical protein KC619_16390 [Myxococcales bacterium]|nr:hypothetical protein [Myxococcales bacterium]